jgi:hypothetical protein
VTSPAAARRQDYAALFLIALATLMLEILLTRIFSVTLWYHLAFVAVSIAMFGMTLGAVIVYLFPSWFAPARLHAALAIASAVFAVTAVGSVKIHLGMPVDLTRLSSPLTDLSIAYSIIAVPFVFSGIVVSLALTKFPGQLSQLYAADLAGAALGCVALIVLIERLDGPPVVLVVAGAAGMATLLFGAGSSLTRTTRHAAISLAAVALAAGGIYTIAVNTAEGLQVRRAKGYRLQRPLFERWNSYSRIEVGPSREERPFGWGLSPLFKPEFELSQLHLQIDAAAETVLTAFDGDLSTLEHLKHDVTNIGHYLTRNGDIFVIGAGGGRDVLSAIAFGQKAVTAVEMNKAIIEAVNGRFGDVTGHLDRRADVRFVNDEARSYLSRSASRFDLIQISLIDTWAATAAGAFVLSENTLYTADSWELFYGKLKDNGILSVSRWYDHSNPVEVYKLTALAADALRRVGVQDPRKHLMLVATPPGGNDPDGRSSVATILLRRSPYTDVQEATIRGVSSRMGFEVALTPTISPDSTFGELAGAGRTDEIVRRIGSHLDPPTDDRPFFFKMDSELLNGLLTFVTALSLAFIVLPIAIKDRRAIRRDAVPSLAFAAIGIAFMLVEISLMQRLTLLLGHPTFSLSVVLAGLLVASGAGSYSTRNMNAGSMEAGVTTRFAALIGVLAIVGLIAPPVVAYFHGAATPVRIAVALALVLAPGFFMGMAFPIAMKIAEARRPSLMAWLWGINGAASICAAVLAVVISSSRGISVAWWTGVVAYIVAALLILRDAGRVAVAPAIRV